MNKMPIERLQQLISYNPETGKLIWLKNQSNFKLAGKESGCRYKDGYAYVRIDNKIFLAHRIAWALHYGYWPETPLDHRDTDRSNNRICNLRLASVTENNRNRGKQSNNTSGYKGVTFNKASGKYQAKIMRNKETFCLGYFHNPKEASDAYKQASKELHNDFSRF